jgi:hypothetical protein
MPTILRIQGFRFFFFSNEGNEPQHIHVESADGYAKFWLNPVSLEDSVGYNSTELNNLRKLTAENETLFLTKWNECFSQNK